MSKPRFDPNKFFQPASANGKPAFDPNQPFEPLAQQSQSHFQRFGKFIPAVGGVAGTLLGTPAGPLGMATGATLGAGAGEAGRQLLGRMLGEEAPMTSLEAATGIGKEAGIGLVSELTGQGVGRLAAQGYKAFPKIAQAFSGTPATNIARAQKRGFGVYKTGVTRKVAGEAQQKTEEDLLRQFFQPKQKVAIDLNQRGFAQNMIEKAALKLEQGERLTPKEAVGVRRAIKVVYPPETAKGAPLGARLAKINEAARQVIAEDLPEFSKRLIDTEKAITRSQLLKPLRVNRTNPDQISGLATTLGAFRPLALAATVPFSPLSMGFAGATMGAAKRHIPALLRRAIQRGAIQSEGRGLITDNL